MFWTQQTFLWFLGFKVSQLIHLRTFTKICYDCLAFSTPKKYNKFQMHFVQYIITQIDSFKIERRPLKWLALSFYWQMRHKEVCNQRKACFVSCSYSYALKTGNKHLHIWWHSEYTTSDLFHSYVAKYSPFIVSLFYEWMICAGLVMYPIHVP